MQQESQTQGSLPLAGKTIVVTRARAQSEDFVAKLEALGAKTVLCPVIEIVPPASYSALDEAIDSLYGYDWLIFTSVNGVEHFLERFIGRGHDTSEFDELLICAVGDSTARRLSDHAIHVDVVPVEFSAEGIFQALSNYLGSPVKFRGLNFLLPRAAVARDFLPEKLREAGSRIDSVAAYQTVKTGAVDKRRVETLLAGGGIDCITFTSGSSVSNFAALFDTNDLGSLLSGVDIACIGEVTKQVADKFGLQTQIVPTQSTVESLAVSIADWYSK